MTQKSESGFSYIDVMIAIVILTVGVLALLAGLSSAVVSARGQNQQMVAKQIATSTMESIMSVKETDPARLGWDAIGNVGSNIVNSIPRGIFLSGFQTVMSDAGPDEVLGTIDDNGTVVPLVQRRIIVTDICDPDRASPNCPTPGQARVRMRTVQVIVSYTVGTMQRQEVVRTVMTDYAKN